MKRVIVLNRKGIQVVAGIVAEVDDVAEIIIIKNSDGSQRLALQCENGQISRMRIKSNSKVIASIKPTVQTIAMAEGELVDAIPAIELYQLRYTGSFDFEEKGSEPEQHVFCGDIKEVVEAENGILVKMQWMRKHEPEVRWIYYAKPEKKETMEKLIGEQVIFITGGIIKVKDVDAYSLQKIGIF